MNCDKHPATGGFDRNNCPQCHRCDKCGAEIQIGEWPFCPHGQMTHFGDEPLTPYVDHNLGPEPIEIRTRGERRRIMAKAHLDYADVSHKKRGQLYVDLHR
jgi:hypothetical protein